MQPIVRRSVLGAGAALPVLALAPPVSASRSVELPPGTPIQLEGTPHLFLVSESHPQLHWVGDTRALATHPVFWDQQKTWGYETFYRWGAQWVGDPYLSAGLLKDGDPIYLVKWEQDWAKPRLYHIQSIKDVELFGINARNYGRFVLDKPTWEAKHGFDVDTLRREQLRPATWGRWRKDIFDAVSPRITYYDRLHGLHAVPDRAILRLRCVRRSEQWRVTLYPTTHRTPTWLQRYTGPVDVQGPIFPTPIAAIKRARQGVEWDRVEWDSGRELVAALIAFLHNAESLLTLTVHFPARGGQAAVLPVEIWPAGIETASAWLEAECAKPAA